jgi:HEPN domain-containing protein
MSPQKQERLFSKPYAKTLFSIADGDYRTAIVLAGASNYRIENAFYHAQQAIEKALKSVLIHREIPVPLVHDLAALLAKLPPDCQSPYGYELNELSEYATVRRYEEGNWQPTATELNEILTKTAQMLAWAKVELAK